MSNFNAIPPFSGATVRDLHEAVGITQQPVGNADTWSQMIGGLLFQGGISPIIAANTATTINFFPAFSKKVLGIFLQTQGNVFAAAPIRNDYVNLLSLSQFQIFNDYGSDSLFYWWAIGY